MPSDAFLRAAKDPASKPVMLMAVESIGALKQSISTTAEWKSCPVGTNLNTGLGPGLITNEYQPTYQAELKNGEYIYIDLPTLPYRRYLKRLAGRVRIEAVDSGNPIWTSSNSGENSVYALSAKGSTVPISLFPANKSWSRGEVQYFDVDLDFEPNVILESDDAVGTALTLYMEGEPLQVKIEWVGDVTLKYFAMNGSLRTPVIDMGSTPSQAARIQLDDVQGADSSITYTARGSNNADMSSAIDFGTVQDGDTLGAVGYRYYDVSATLTSTGTEASISEIRIVGGDSQYEHFSTHRDEPVSGAVPIIQKAPAISSKIEMLEGATTGEVSVGLAWTREAGDLIAQGRLKGRTVLLKVGFAGLAESEFEIYLRGFWHDYAADHKGRTLTVKLRDALAVFEGRKLPHATGSGLPRKDFSGNVVQQILDIYDAEGVPDRLFDRDSFTALRDGSRSGAAWAVARTLEDPEDVKDLLKELAATAGIWLVPGPSGIEAVEYDPSAAVAATLDARHCDFGALDGGEKDMHTRVFVYHQPAAGVDDPRESDYGEIYAVVDPDGVETEWGSLKAKEKKWLDKWGATQAAVAALGDRLYEWFGRPAQKVTARKVPLRLMGVNVGDIVAIDNLRVPAAAANWPGYSSQVKALVISKKYDHFSRSLEFGLRLTGEAAPPGIGSWVSPIAISGPANPEGAGNTYTATGYSGTLNWEATAGTLTDNGDGTADLDVTGLRGAVTLSAWDDASKGTLRVTIRPAAPTALTADGAVESIRVAAAVTMIAGDRTEIHAASSNDRSLAAKIADLPEVVHAPLAAGATRYYWARVVDENGVAGDWYPSGATAGVSGTAQAVSSGSATYSDGTPIDNLKPSESGSTAGATWGTNISGQPADFTNMLYGCGFEDEDAIPFPLSGRFSRDNTQAQTGSHSLKVGPGSVNDDIYSDNSPIEVKEGDEFYAELWARKDATFNGTSSWSKLRFSTNMGFLAAVGYGAADLAAVDTWEKRTGTFTIPAGATELNVQITGDNTAGNAWVDNIVLRRKTEWGEVTGSGKPADNADVTADSEFVTATYPADKADLQSQIDGKIESWFQDTDPAAGWSTAAEKAKHVDDMWWKITAKELYRYKEAAGVYSWDGPLTDQKAIDAYANAATAQDTADQKRRVFVATPTPPYDVGDLWDTGSQINRCKTAKSSGLAYSEDDWQRASDITANNAQDTSWLSDGTIGENAVANAGFEEGDAKWSKQQGWIIVNDAANAYSGSWLAKRTVSDGTSASLGNAAFVPCAPGDRFYVEGYLKTSSDFSTSGSGYGVRVAWFDASKAYLSSSSVTNTAASTSYVKSHGIVAAPSGAAYARMDGVVYAQTGGTVYFDRAILKRAVTETNIDDLAISTGKIKDDAVNVVAHVYNDGYNLVGSAWVTIASLSVSVPSGTPLFVQGHFMAANPTAGGFGYKLQLWDGSQWLTLFGVSGLDGSTDQIVVAANKRVASLATEQFRLQAYKCYAAINVNLQAWGVKK